ncbi:hypothetical protein CSC94_17610 [Zhengella mangrovi]|uniref:LPS export ABC transporter permease LptG n=1 Tax=Zhengella mangrovi TaxID=1982044 RepID=A0A2G1QJG0_9HYPH|nr:LptF/LptG family permease [Zhengella mangrovi]PHP65665.1 hypothetical protein CSC94_17610 [Zhengella mangrovi]
MRRTPVPRTVFPGQPKWLQHFPRTYTGYMVRHHAWFILVCFVGIVATVTAIDVAPEISRVWQEQSQQGTRAGVSRTLLFIVLRLLDNGTQSFPISFVLGMLWGEVAHAWNGRLAMIRTSGMPFLRRTYPVLLIAAASVPVLFTLDNFVRPAAFMTQSRQGLGEYGWSFEKKRTERTLWIARGDTVVHGTLNYDPRPHFQDVMLFYFTDRGSMTGIAHAARLEPSADPAGEWILKQADVRSVAASAGQAGEGSAASAVEHFVSHPSGIRISRLWLDYLRIHPKYIPFGDLVRLSGDTALPDDHPAYREWLMIRLFQSLAPALIVLSLSAIFALLLDRYGLLRATVASLFAAYALYSVTRISAVIIENSPASPFLVTMAFPLLCTGLFVALLAAVSRADEIP